jgi:hypothetical protein
MSVTLRPYRGGGWEVDITLRLPDGSRHRERKRESHFSKSAAQRWAQDRERYLLHHGPPAAKKEVPTFAEFAPRFVDGHARPNRHKPSGIAATEPILKWHLVPALGAKRLDAITNEQVQRLKLALAERAPKTVNNVLTVLSTPAEESRGVGRARTAAVHDPVVAKSQEDDGPPRLRSVRAAVDSRQETRGRLPDGVVGW